MKVQRGPIIIPALIFMLFSVAAHAGVQTWDMVGQYGMQATNAKPAIDNALADAKSYLATHPDDEVVLHFPAGTWNVVNPTAPGIYINDFPAGKLTLRGESSSQTILVFSQFDREGIYIRFTDYVTIEKMHLTRPQLYTTQGDVVSAASGTVRVQLHEGFPDPVWLANQASSLTHERVLVPFDGGLLNPVSSEVSTKILFTDVMDAGGGLYDFAIASGHISKSLNLTAGQQVAIKAKTGIGMIFGYLSDHDTIQDIRITKSSRDGIWMRACDHQVVRRVRIDRGDPINGRMPFFSQSADGIHIWSTQGGGDILVEENTIIGTADDGIAVIITDASYSGLYATNIVIRNNTVKMGLARSIILNLADGAEVYGNTLTSLSTHGILMESVINTVVMSNTIVDNRHGYGIHLKGMNVAGTAFPSGNRILSNIFGEVNEDMHLIVLENATDTEVDGNLVATWSSVNGYAPANLGNPAPLLYAKNCNSVYGTNYLANPTSMWLVGSSVSIGITINWAGDPIGLEIPTFGPQAIYPEIASMESGDLEVSWLTDHTTIYQLQKCTNLVERDWGDMGGIIFGSGSRMSVTSTPVGASGFYRIIAE